MKTDIVRSIKVLKALQREINNLAFRLVTISFQLFQKNASHFTYHFVKDKHFVTRCEMYTQHKILPCHSVQQRRIIDYSSRSRRTRVFRRHCVNRTSGFRKLRKKNCFSIVCRLVVVRCQKPVGWYLFRWQQQRNSVGRFVVARRTRLYYVRICRDNFVVVSQRCQ